MILPLILLTACAAPPRPAAPPPATSTPIPPTATPVPSPTTILSPTTAPSDTPPPLVAPTDTPATSAAPADLNSGVEGRVEMGPTCGNVPLGGEADCANQPHQAQLTILDQNEQIVAEGLSEADGTFRFELPPGQYRLTPETSRFLSTSPVEFTVEPDQFIYVTVLYHTNIQ